MSDQRERESGRVITDIRVFLKKQVPKNSELTANPDPSTEEPLLPSIDGSLRDTPVVPRKPSSRSSGSEVICRTPPEKRPKKANNILPFQKRTP